MRADGLGDVKGGAGRVLLVSTEEKLAATLTKMLQTSGHGWHLTFVSERAAAIEQLPLHDVCLLDAWMPHALSLLVRARDDNVSTPVIWLGVDDDLTATAVLGAGAVECITLDSLDARLLLRSLRYACSRAEIKRNLDQKEALLEGSQRVMHDMMADFRDALLVIGHAGIVRYANTAASHLFQENPVGRPYPFLLLGEDGLYESEIEVAGSVRILEVQLSTTSWSGESAVLASVRDVSERRYLEDRLRRTHYALDASQVGITIMDALQPGYTFAYLNPAFERMVGVPAARLIGKTCPLLQSLNDDPMRSVLSDAIENGKPCQIEFRATRPDGAAFWDDLQMAPVRDMEGNITHLVAFHSDVTERVEAKRQLEWQAQHNLLCGLLNRCGLSVRLADVFRQGRARGEWTTVLLANIDDFHALNATYNHAVGDGVILMAARRLREISDPDVLLARVGGGEFVIATTRLDGHESTLAYAQRICAALSRPYEFGGISVALSCRVGVCPDDGSVDEAMALVRNADIAMRRSGRASGDAVTFFRPEMAERMRVLVSLRAELQAAIEHGELVTLYQPQIDAHTSRVVGVEALVRWQHPTRGLLTPDQFLSIAVDTGQILEIGDIVLRQACADVGAMRAAGLPEFAVSVNVSSREFLDERFVERVDQALAAAQLPADSLEIELSRKSLPDESEDLQRRFDVLRRKGVRLVIDNFGVGGLDLESLRNLPATKIKIGRSLTGDATQDARAAAIIHGVVSMARRLEMAVVAEGVESEPQRDFLRKIGCEVFQGNWVSPPVTRAALEGWLREHQVDQSAVAPAVAEGALPSLLLVDDEPNILRALSRLLRRDGYQIFTAGSAREAFAILASNDVQVIISDQRMPEMCGTDFLAQVKDLHPQTVRMVLSGYTDLKSVTDAINQGAIYRFITKPWVDEELRESVRKAFAGRLHRNHPEDLRVQ